MSQIAVPAPISVVIPAHNAEPFIQQAIESVYAQTIKVTELIVVADDCSDRTAQIATEHGAKVLHQQRRNMAAALNVGVKSSTQLWIALLDADDIWRKTKVASQWKAIQACPEAALVSCDYVQLEEGKTTLLPDRFIRERWNNIDSVKIDRQSRFVPRVEGDFLPSFNLLTPCTMVRRDVFDRVGFFDEELLFGQTMEFFARALACFPLAFVERRLVEVRRHDNNHTRNLEAYWPTYISIVDRMLRHPDRYPPGTGQAYRARLKQSFHQFERELLKPKRLNVQPSQPNQP